MSVWTRKDLGKQREYVVIRHKLRDIEGHINGVKFRRGFAVVDKASKRYNQLKRLPFLKTSQDLPLTHLKNLKFITRPSDVKSIWGQDVYHHYQKAIQEEFEKQKAEEQQKEEEEHRQDSSKCQYRSARGNLCKYPAHEKSPSGYCNIHILNDEKLSELGVRMPPKRLTHQQKKEEKQRVLDQLEKVSQKKANEYKVQ